MTIISGRGVEMTMRSGSHDKYWQVILAGNTVTTRYGKIGSVGQVTVHHLASSTQASNKYVDLIISKERKGYTPTRGSRTRFDIPLVLTESAKSTSQGTGRGGNLTPAAHALVAYFLEQVVRNSAQLECGDPLWRLLQDGTVTARRLALAAFAGMEVTNPHVITTDEESLAVMGGLTAYALGMSLADV